MTDREMLILEEFKALRSEILTHQVYQQTLVVWGTSALGALLTFAYTAESVAVRPSLLLIVQLLSMGFWYSWERLAIHTERIGAYICLRMEGTGLLWESFQRHWPLPSGTGKDAYNKAGWDFVASTLMCLPFLLISVACVWLQYCLPYNTAVAGSTGIQAGSFALLAVTVLGALVACWLKLPNRFYKKVSKRIHDAEVEWVKSDEASRAGCLECSIKDCPGQPRRVSGASRNAVM